MPNLVNPYIFPFPPLNSDLIAWYDAQDPLGTGRPLSSGSAVSSWVDKSVNARNASQNVSGARPTYTYNVLNGNPGILFDGSASYMFLAADWNLPSTSTIFTYVQPTLSSQGGGIILGSISNTGGWSQNIRYQGNVPELSCWNLNIATATVTATTSSVIWSLRTNTGTSAAQFRQNGTNLSTTSIITGNPFIMGQIGALGNPGPPGAGFFQGYIFEILIYNAYLTDGQCASVESYFAAKWG